MRTADEFKRAYEEHGMVHWPIHECTFCHYPVGYTFTPDGVFFDTGCWCVRQMDQPRRESWGAVARQYNMQDHPDVIARYDVFWHFTLVTS